MAGVMEEAGAEKASHIIITWRECLLDYSNPASPLEKVIKGYCTRPNNHEKCMT